MICEDGAPAPDAAGTLGVIPGMETRSACLQKLRKGAGGSLS